MKFVVVQGGGLPDEPIADLGGKTPLEVARTPNLDHLAARGILGLARTIPHGMPPAGAVGALSVLGYDPARHRAGSAALEAVGLGVELGPADVAFRLSLVTLDVAESGEVMRDPSGGYPSSAEAGEILTDLRRGLAHEGIEIFVGAGQRHLLVWRRGEGEAQTTAPYELIDKPVAAALPRGAGGAVLCELMERSRAILAAHPVCQARLARGERAPTAIWLWDPALRATLPTLRERYGVEGSVVAGADLMNGLGLLAGLARIAVPGVPGLIENDVHGRAEQGLRALAERELLLVHVEGADESGHLGDAQRKIAAIESLDAHLLGPLLEGLRQSGSDWRLLVMPDHPTPCALRRHTDDPVPFIVYLGADDRKTRVAARRYSEKDAREHGIFVPEGHTILGRLLRR